MLIRWKKDKGTSANSGSNKSSTKKKRKFGREGKVVCVVFDRFGRNLVSRTWRYQANFVLEFILLCSLTPYSSINGLLTGIGTCCNHIQDRRVSDLYPEDGGSRFIRKVGGYVTNYTSSHSGTWLVFVRREPQIANEFRCASLAFSTKVARRT